MSDPLEWIDESEVTEVDGSEPLAAFCCRRATGAEAGIRSQKRQTRKGFPYFFCFFLHGGYPDPYMANPF